MKITTEQFRHLYYGKGFILKEIALKHDTSVSYLRKMMKRHGMKTMRGPSKYRKLIVQKCNLPMSLRETDIFKHADPNIPEKVLEVMLGALLGDSSTKVRQNKYDRSYNLQFGHNEKQLGYLQYKHNIMTDAWTNPIHKERDETDCTIHGETYHKKAFYTFTSKPLNLHYIYNLLYRNESGEMVKFVNHKYLNYLTPLSLAIWYMDDGSYSYDNRIIRFSTMGFTKEDNEIIRDYFVKDLRMPCVVERVDSGSGYSIMLPQNSTKKFLALIRPYQCECLNYKFPANPSETLKAAEIAVSKGAEISQLNNAGHPTVYTAELLCCDKDDGIVQPLVKTRDTKKIDQAVGRKLLLVDELPQGAIARYERDVSAIAHIVARRGAVPDQIQQGEEILVPTFEIAANPQVRLSEIKARRFYIVDRA